MSKYPCVKCDADHCEGCNNNPYQESPCEYLKSLFTTMAKIEDGTFHKVEHRVHGPKDGSCDMKLRKYLKDNWNFYKCKSNESFISPCGKYRSLVIETGVVMLTTAPPGSDETAHPRGTKFCVWPDGDWCLEEEIEEYSWKSDDYVTKVLLEDETEEDIETHIELMKRLNML